MMIENRDAGAPPVTGHPTNGNGFKDGDGPKQLPPAPEQKALPPGPPPPRRRSRAWIWVLLLAIAGFVAFRAYQGIEQKNQAAAAAQEKRAANRPVSIAAAPARRGNMPIYLRGLGTVQAYNTVNVKTRIDGPIVSVNFKEGQFVNKGDVLVEIDPRTFQAVVDQARGQLARDQAQLHDAQVNLARYQALWQAQVIAKQQLDTQAAQVGQFQGTIEADKANIESAELNLGFARVTAPISGRIGLRQVDIGNIVHASDANPLAVITQMQPIAVLFTIPADNLQPVLAKLRSGATLPVDAYDRADRNKIASGTLESVDNQIDPSTGTSRLKSVFPNQDNALFPQQFVNARLLLETRRGVTIVPAPAIQRGPQGPYVYVVGANQTAQMRPVTLGQLEGNDQQVTSGVAPGDLVVTDGQDKLQEGGKVEIRQEGNAPAGGLTRGTASEGMTPQTGAGNGTGNADRTSTGNASGVPAGRGGHSGDRGQGRRGQ
jgi:membrane fusion protein, multidrug efflux system